MTMQKMIYGVLNGTVYVASGAALMRAIAAPVIMSTEPFTMGELRALIGPELAESLVLDAENDEVTVEDGAVERPIDDTQQLTADNIDQDRWEDITWIEHAMHEELPSVLRQDFGSPITFRGGYGLQEKDLEGIETFLRGEGYELHRDDSLIALIEDYDLKVARALEAKQKVIGYVGNWEEPQNV